MARIPGQDGQSYTGFRALKIENSWEQRKDLVHNIMIQEVGVDVEIKRVLWEKARSDYKPLFSILDGLRQDAARRFWIERVEAQENICDIEEDTGQMGTGVEIRLQMSHNVLTISEEYVK